MRRLSKDTDVRSKKLFSERIPGDGEHSLHANGGWLFEQADAKVVFGVADVLREPH